MNLICCTEHFSLHLLSCPKTNLVQHQKGSGTSSQASLLLNHFARGYSNVQLDTKCVVENPKCAVENWILCSNFYRNLWSYSCKCCIVLFRVSSEVTVLSILQAHWRFRGDDKSCLKNIMQGFNICSCLSKMFCSAVKFQDIAVQLHFSIAVSPSNITVKVQ